MAIPQELVSGNERGQEKEEEGDGDEEVREERQREEETTKKKQINNLKDQGPVNERCSPI